MSRFFRRLTIVVLLCLAAVDQNFALSAAEVTLADKGQAKLIIRADSDSQRLVALAGDLQQMFNRITGGSFEIADDDDSAGIILQVKSGQPPNVFERETYSIRSEKDRLVLSGRTEDAVQHAVWDFFHRLGYRQFFPGETWEVVPQLETVRVDLDVQETPDYYFRRIWPGYGFWDYNQQAWSDWDRKNRMGGSLQVNSGHAYGQIIRSQQEAFDKHPEYYALINGQRQVQPQAKLCIGNPALRLLAVKYAREFFESRPDQQCVSVDPSDGGGWCECELCRKIGPPTDRAVLLANEVAAAVNAGHDTPRRFVGMYAYNYHSPPPGLDVHPQVIINVATAFIKGGRTLDQLISGWSEKGATIGIREYYSVNTWDRDLPGASRGSNLEYLARTIPEFHAKGARFLNSESSDNWGCNGLGYYFASRAMWDIDQARQREAVVEDFLNKAFGPAKEPMREYYHLIDGANDRSKLVFDNLLARMYRQLSQARKAAEGDESVQARINHLILYTRYVDLFDQYRHAEGPARQKAFEQMIRHVYRMRGTLMVHAKALYRDVPARDRSVAVPKNAAWQTPEEENPWKSSRPFSDRQLTSYLEEGIAGHKIVELDFEPRQFSQELVPATPLELAEVAVGSAGRARGRRSFYAYLDEPGEIVLNVTGGMIAHYRDRGNVKVAVWKLGGASEGGQRETLAVQDASVPPDGQERQLVFPLKEAGRYRIDVNDGSDLTQVTWPAGQRICWKMSLDEPAMRISGRWYLWFYVPRGTKRIGLYVDAQGGSLQRPDGETTLEFTERGGQFISADVPQGMDGTLWKLHHVAGRVSLLNVPPYLARSTEELLLPAEVVQSEK